MILLEVVVAGAEEVWSSVKFCMDGESDGKYVTFGLIPYSF